MVVKKAEWWLGPTTADQCGQNPVYGKGSLPMTFIMVTIEHAQRVKKVCYASGQPLEACAVGCGPCLGRVVQCFSLGSQACNLQ